ncbi:YisL family protein [Niallia sp. 03133]|uniref:YisL family protein n=1 Tax=Niallia sp. 03133 TaxID=3458060 RepID=UPI004043C34A
MTHAHITSWLLALILFVIAYGLHKSGKEKGSKIVHMILRLMYLFVIGTGIWMLYTLGSLPPMYVLKTLVGLWVIVALEMILVRTKKGRQTTILWTQFVVALVLVLYLGMTLPMGLWHFG